MPTFELWLEFELWRDAGGTDDPTNDCFNMQVTLDDGRKYALNVWTFGFFARLATDAKSEAENLNCAYMLPPDLFVERMDRGLIESVVADMIATNCVTNGWSNPTHSGRTTWFCHTSFGTPSLIGNVGWPW